MEAPMYKKELIGVSPAMHIYYWDERDGLRLCGWWISTQVGGDRAWAYNADSEAKVPPLSNWQAPWDGPVDPSIMLRVDASASAPSACIGPQAPHTGVVQLVSPARLP